jgi:hypothetical protein
MLGQTSRMSSHQNKEKVPTNMCPGMSGFWVLKITSNHKHLNCVILYLQLTQYIYSTRSQFNNCWVLIVYRVTIHNKWSKCLPPESVHAWTRLIMDCSTLSKVLGRLRMVWQTQTCVGEVSLHFHLELNTLGFLDVLTHKKVKNWVCLHVGAVPRKLFAPKYIDMEFSPCFYVGDSLMKLVETF